MITQKIYAAPLNSRILFALHPLLAVDGESRVQPISNNAGDHLYWGSGAPVYTAHSLAGSPSPTVLRGAEGGFVPAREFYTQLPDLSSEVLTLADSLLTDQPTDFDKATTLVEWFREEFTYTLDLPGSAREATLENFLLNRRAGHCEYFSTAMAILLRTQGIAAREVNGFAGGSWSEFGEYLAVTQNQAHAWVEVWFPEVGWVTFDPTPPGRGENSALGSWFWPGRFLFDAIQHRWNKWVLDYSFQTQFDLFERSREALGSGPSGQGEAAPDRGRRLPLSLILWLVGGAILLWAALEASRRTRAERQETRIFLRLREMVRRAGVPDSALHSPMALTRYLEDRDHPAAAPARAVVEGYIRARFSGRLMREEQEKAMVEALDAAKIFLRKPVKG
jgi:hypothetical protein